MKDDLLITRIKTFFFNCRQSTRLKWTKSDEEHEEMFTQQQAQIKQGWSLLATLHCVLLPDKVCLSD